jgi:hypothetical protein
MAHGRRENAMDGINKDELDRFECFGVPAHVWLDNEGTVIAAPSGSTRRNWVYRESAMMLGAEALPSPALPEAAVS